MFQVSTAAGPASTTIGGRGRVAAMMLARMQKKSIDNSKFAALSF